MPKPLGTKLTADNMLLHCSYHGTNRWDTVLVAVFHVQPFVASLLVYVSSWREYTLHIFVYLKFRISSVWYHLGILPLCPQIPPVRPLWLSFTKFIQIYKRVTSSDSYNKKAWTDSPIHIWPCHILTSYTVFYLCMRQSRIFHCWVQVCRHFPLIWTCFLFPALLSST